MISVYVTALIRFAGGLGMFIYGLNRMSECMQKSVGVRMKGLLKALSRNHFVSVFAGAAVTAILQSSACTTVMVVGFVNAGIMTLTQVVGVIMGANIGTTVTSWMISMTQWGGFMRPQYMVLVFICVGAFIIQVSKNERRRTIGEILFGFGILIIGFGVMTNAAQICTMWNGFLKFIVLLGRNPLFPVFFGILITVFLQSSAVSIGITQNFAVNGFVTFKTAVFLVLGQNIGTCIITLFSTAGTQRMAKRAAVIHLFFNMTGAIFYGIIANILFRNFPLISVRNVNSIDIALIHTLFNISCTILLLPFTKILVKSSEWIVGKYDQEDEENDVVVTRRHLDKRFFESPAAAVTEVGNEVIHMGEVAYETAKLSFDAIILSDLEKANEVFEKEKTIDEMTDIILRYLAQISSLPLTKEQHVTITNLFYTVSNFERMGDHSENIAELCRYMLQNDICFSQPAYKELEGIMEIVTNSFVYSIRSRRDLSKDSARRAKKYEKLVDFIEGELRTKHMKRIEDDLCKPTAGVVFLEILSNLERISDHADNVAGYVIDEL